MKILIIGYGSIGKRHKRVITNLLGPDKCNVYIFEPKKERRIEAEGDGCKPITDLFAESQDMDVIVVASPTSTHADILNNIQIPSKLLYLEKPMDSDFLRIAPIARRLIKNKPNDCKFVVGYMLRHHPGIQKIKELHAENTLGPLLKYRLECGMYLPNWHPWEDYRDFYMSDIDGGGGALLDISHEIDMALNFSGEANSVFGFFGNISDLDCTSDDFTEILIKHKNGIIGSIGLDLIQKKTSRKAKFVFQKGEAELDFIEKLLSVSYDQERVDKNQFSFEADDLYEKQYKSALNNNDFSCCDFTEGLKVMEVIHAVRASSVNGTLQNLPIYSR